METEKSVNELIDERTFAKLHWQSFLSIGNEIKRSACSIIPLMHFVSEGNLTLLYQ